MMKKRKRNEFPTDDSVREMLFTIPKLKNNAMIFDGIATFGLAVYSILQNYGIISPQKHPLPCYGLFGILVFIGLFGLYLHYRSNQLTKKDEENYRYYVESKRLSTAILTTIRRIQSDKITNILESTYEKTSEAFPVDYENNILVYNVHKHLRQICIRIKELIVSLAPDQFNDDMVTVDLLFQYPSDHCFELVDPDYSHDKDKSPSSYWKVISSGEHTSPVGNIPKFTDQSESFYYYLIHELLSIKSDIAEINENSSAFGYYFANDKEQLNSEKHYLWTSKDIQYSKVGSIIGVLIQLKNDIPDVPFVYAILTISTYGRRIVEKGKGDLDEEAFKNLFKMTIMNSFKTLIEEELTQMFIRHGIKNRIINRNNGVIKLRK